MIILDKINISKIVEDHIDTLKYYNTNKKSKGDIFLFFIVPLILSSAIVYFEFIPTEGTITIFVTALSIFAALLFNLLLLIYDITSKSKNTEQKDELTSSFIKEIYSNVSFSILIAITTIILSIVYYIWISTCTSEVEIINLSLTTYIFSFLIYYFMIQFLLTLLMILKRIHALLSNEIQ